MPGRLVSAAEREACPSFFFCLPVPSLAECTTYEAAQIRVLPKIMDLLNMTRCKCACCLPNTYTIDYSVFHAMQVESKSSPNA